MALLPPDPVFCLKSPEQCAYHCICFRTPEHLYAGTLKGTVQLWDLQTNRSAYQLSVGTGPILNLSHTEDALITQEKAGMVKLWNLAEAGYELQHELSSDHIGFCRLAYDAKANAVIIPREQSAVSVLCPQTFSETMRFSPTAQEEKSSLPFGSVMCVLPIELASQRYMLAGYESGVMAAWDFRTGRLVGEPTRFAFNGDCLLTLDYDPVTNRGICGGVSDKLSVFSIDRKTLQVVPKSEIAIKNPGVHRVRIRKDLKVFSSAGWDGRIRIFSWKSLRPLAVLTEHKDELLDIAYSEGKVSMWNAPVMAAAGNDGQISLWDLYN